MRFTDFSCAGLMALLVACHGSSQPPGSGADGLPTGGLAQLHGTWLLVPEASRADTLAYRRNTYRFKYRPGGRPGFRLGPNGRFTRYDPAPGGGLLAHDGTWQETTTGRLLIHLPTLPDSADYELAPMGLRSGLLRVRRLARRPTVEVLRQLQ